MCHSWNADTISRGSTTCPVCNQADETMILIVSLQWEWSWTFTVWKTHRSDQILGGSWSSTSQWCMINRSIAWIQEQHEVCPIQSVQFLINFKRRRISPMWRLGLIDIWTLRHNETPYHMQHLENIYISVVGILYISILYVSAGLVWEACIMAHCNSRKVHWNTLAAPGKHIWKFDVNFLRSLVIMFLVPSVLDTVG